MSNCNAKCTKCGKFITLDAAEEAANCPACGKAIITQKAISAFKESVNSFNAICPKCGELLSVDTHEDAANCEKCGKAFITQKAIDAFSEKYGNAAPEPSPAEDFEIINGVLKLYLGNSEDVVIPNGVCEIADGAFNDGKDEAVCTVYIPEGVTRIGRYAFSGCYELEQIHIPSSVTDISEGAFAYIVIDKFDVANENPKYRVISGCLVDTFTKTLIAAEYFASVPNDGSVQHLADYSFAGASWLETHAGNMLIIPEGIVSIGTECFAAASMKAVTFPESLTFIGKEAFVDTEVSQLIFRNKCGWTYNGVSVDVSGLDDYDTVDNFIGAYGFKYPLIRK
ncbi:MAG: leucine-rich repeat domain-containing protein [Clostridia bacterium]|nr:leucine-rich repeat domain-containing protein [Clostridia bacterium]